jgi:pilus assembly protein Flp/PilA
MIAENPLALRVDCKGLSLGHEGIVPLCRASWSVSDEQDSRVPEDDSGATAIEYGLIAAGITIVIIGAVQGIGTSLNARFDTVSTQLK